MTVLEASPGSLAERIGTRLRGRHPALIAWMVTGVSYLVLVVLMAGIGLLLVHVLIHGPVGRWDTRVEQWFVTRRTPRLNTWTKIASMMGATGTVVGIAAVGIVLLAIARRWREIGLLFFGLVLETAVFITTTFLVDRPRPRVPRLDAAPPTSSFPSGHTAAAIVLYVGLAIVISLLVRGVVIRILVWLVALLPVAVGLSRLYRGMHNPTDVLASVLLGSACLLLTIVAVRSAPSAARPSAAGSDSGPGPRGAPRNGAP